MEAFKSVKNCLLGRDPTACAIKHTTPCEHCSGYMGKTMEEIVAVEIGDEPAVAPLIPTIFDVDARVKGYLMTTCEFAGHKMSPDGARRCKHYDKAAVSTWRCMYYKPEPGCCDCIQP